MSAYDRFVERCGFLGIQGESEVLFALTGELPHTDIVELLRDGIPGQLTSKMIQAIIYGYKGSLPAEIEIILDSHVRQNPHVSLYQDEIARLVNDCYAIVDDVDTDDFDWNEDPDENLECDCDLCRMDRGEVVSYEIYWDEPFTDD